MKAQLDEEELSAQIRKSLEACIEKGFISPLVLVSVGFNGALFALRTDGENVTVLADHDEGGRFVTPINIMVVDSRGEAARIVIQGGELEPRFVN